MMVTGMLSLALAPVFGSFMGVVIRRLPAGKPIALDRSACDRCNTVLSVPDLIPIVSFAALFGRCRHCGLAISRFHIWVEFAAIVIALISVACSAPNDAPLNCGLGWLLLTLAWIDAETFLLPDKLTFPLIGSGVVYRTFWRDDLLTALIGAAVGYILIWVLGEVYRMLRGREGIGLGDAKLLAGAGAWLGWANLPLVLVFSSLTALIAITISLACGARVRRETAIPFGPFLALGFWSVRMLEPYAPILFRAHL